MSKHGTALTEGQQQKENQFLKLISGDKSLVLDAVNGTETLAKAKGIFADIDFNFIWEVNKKGPATKETFVAVYEMTKDATFMQMFGALSPNMQNLRLTQAQIKNFVKKHRKWLRTGGYATFFLFEANSNFFVAGVDFYFDDSLDVLLHRFEYSRVWSASRRHWLVAPLA